MGMDRREFLGVGAAAALTRWRGAERMRRLGENDDDFTEASLEGWD